MDLDSRGWAAGLQIAATMTVVALAAIGAAFMTLFTINGVW